MKKPLAGLQNLLFCHFSGHYKTAVQNRFVISKIGVTPISELLYILSDQHFDRFSQLFLKKPRVKTHTGEYGFDIVQHIQ